MRKHWLPLLFLAGLTPLLAACAALDETLGSELGLGDLWPILRAGLIGLVSLCTIAILILLVILINRTARARRKTPPTAPTGRAAEIATTITPAPAGLRPAAVLPPQPAVPPAAPADFQTVISALSAADSLPSANALSAPDASSGLDAFSGPDASSGLDAFAGLPQQELTPEPPTDPGIQAVQPPTVEPPAVEPPAVEPPVTAEPPAPEFLEPPAPPLPAYDPYPLLESLQAPALLAQVNKFKLAGMGQVYTIPSGFALEWLSPTQKACSVLILALSPDSLQVNDRVIPADAASLKSAIAAALRGQLL